MNNQAIEQIDFDRTFHWNRSYRIRYIGGPDVILGIERKNIYTEEFEPLFTVSAAKCKTRSEARCFVDYQIWEFTCQELKKLRDKERRSSSNE